LRERERERKMSSYDKLKFKEKASMQYLFTNNRFMYKIGCCNQIPDFTYQNNDENLSDESLSDGKS
jgi:hypothetical protein